MQIVRTIDNFFLFARIITLNSYSKELYLLAKNYDRYHSPKFQVHRHVILCLTFSARF